jgi:hypothetical protein
LTGQIETHANKNKQSTFSLGPDTWAVMLALILALLIGIGVIKHVPW